MRISGSVDRGTCAICGRSLLTGERPTRYAPSGSEFVDVCPLCEDVATEHGWLKEGSPTTPMVRVERPRRRLSLSALFHARRSPAPSDAPVASELMLRRLTPPELAMFVAADLFNASVFWPTCAGFV